MRPLSLYCSPATFSWSRDTVPCVHDSIGVIFCQQSLVAHSRPGVVALSFFSRHLLRYSFTFSGFSFRHLLFCSLAFSLFCSRHLLFRSLVFSLFCSLCLLRSRWRHVSKTGPVNGVSTTRKPPSLSLSLFSSFFLSRHLFLFCAFTLSLFFIFHRLTFSRRFTGSLYGMMEKTHPPAFTPTIFIDPFDQSAASTQTLSLSFSGWGQPPPPPTP